MMSQPQNLYEKCENITAIRDGQVYCYRLQAWIDPASCSCSPETRAAQASQEW